MDRLLHHVAELAGGDGLALPGHRRGLDRQQLAADFGPGEAGDLADLVLLLGHAEGVAAHAEKLVEVLRRDGNAMALLVTRLLFGEELLHRLAADLGELALERAHAGLARVVAHDVADRGFRDRDLALVEAVGFICFGSRYLTAVVIFSFFL